MIPEAGAGASERTGSAQFSLAGLRVELDCSLSPPIQAWSDSYHPFLSTDCTETPSVRFCVGSEDRRPDDARFSATYGIGAWQLGEMDGRRLYRFHWLGGRVFLWAEPNDGFKKVDVWLEKDERSLVPPLQYPVDRVLGMGMLAHHGGFIVHACGWTCNGKSLLFPGISGAGKSTLCRQLMAAGRGRILSDDRIIVRKVQSEILACGTPWPGDARQARNEYAPLAALCFLEKSPEDRLVPIRPAEALRRLFEVVSVPWFSPDLRDLVLPLLDRLVVSVPSFRLGFHPDPGVIECLRPLVENPLPQNGRVFV
jgi:hypothetical protein